MDVITKKINWFPGHMKKALDEIREKTKLVDLFIEVLDARCIETSSNNELTQFSNNKPVLKIALKSDLSSINPSSVHRKDLLIGNIKDKNFKNLIVKKLYELLNDKFKKLEAKGLKNPKFLVMIVGLPNVGKSSLINLLKGKNIVIAENKPGVTKSQRLVSINQHFDLIDTPGILFKKIEDWETGYKLSLINCIKREVLNVNEVLEYGFNYLKTHHLNLLLNYYHLETVSDYHDFFTQICLKRQYLLSNHELDTNRFEDVIYNDFSLSKITKVNYDK